MTSEKIKKNKHKLTKKKTKTKGVLKLEGPDLVKSRAFCKLF